MLDELLERKDVLEFIRKIKTSERYFQKKKNSFNDYPFFIGDELALYVFYEALLKYKIIIDDISLFSEYLEQLDKLYKKLLDIDDILVGINRLITRITSIKLGFRNISSDMSRQAIISFIYNKYILDGYFIHGFNSSYEKEIKENGFIPEVYENYYEDFLCVDELFKKYKKERIINKDFSSKGVYFTDNIVLSCYYSKYSPLFFYKFLTNKKYISRISREKRKDFYLKGDYINSVKPLKKYISEELFLEKDKKFINDLVRKQWDLLHRKNNSKISLMLIKNRSVSNYNRLTLEDFLNDQSDLNEVIDRLLSSKNNNIYLEKSFESCDIEIVSLNDYYDSFQMVECDSLTKSYSVFETLSKSYADSYGKVSILMILGSLLISLGVIISVFIILGGM